MFNVLPPAIGYHFCWQSSNPISPLEAPLTSTIIWAGISRKHTMEARVVILVIHSIEATLQTDCITLCAISYCDLHASAWLYYGEIRIHYTISMLRCLLSFSRKGGQHILAIFMVSSFVIFCGKESKSEEHPLWANRRHGYTAHGYKKVERELWSFAFTLSQAESKAFHLSR